MLLLSANTEIARMGYKPILRYSARGRPQREGTDAGERPASSLA
jgi:hypothetical protein